MAIFSNIQHPLTFTFGILGNVISFMVYLAPAPTFYRIVKQKSTKGFQSIPYVVALFSSMIWIYYASLKPDATLLITINAVGCVIETLYIAIYIAYAPKNIKIQTTKLVVSLNFVGFWVIAIFTHYLAEGPTRAQILGWICLVISVSVFAAPLSIMRKVIRTKSVEFMPFGLSFFLALSGVMWFFYGLLQRDFFVALPNIIGFVLGLIQMVLYAIFKNSNKRINDLEKKLPTSNSTLERSSISNAQKCDENKKNIANDKITILKCTQEVHTEVKDDEPSMVCTIQPISDLIEEVINKDVTLEASSNCISLVQPINAFEDHNQKINMVAANPVCLIESAA